MALHYHCNAMKERSKPTSQKRTNYPAFWKRKIVEEILVGLLSEQHACEKYNLPVKKLRQAPNSHTNETTLSYYRISQALWTVWKD